MDKLELTVEDLDNQLTFHVLPESARWLFEGYLSDDPLSKNLKNTYENLTVIYTSNQNHGETTDT